MVMALADALQTLLRLPGATYSCVVERDSGRVLAELGRGEAGTGDSEGVVPYSVPRWGTAVAAMFDSTSGDELDDVMITGRRSYHLVRPLGPGAEVLMRAKLDVMQKLGLRNEGIEDVLISLSIQYHLIRPIQGAPDEKLFIYVALNKAQANLAMARRDLRVIEQEFFMAHPSSGGRNGEGQAFFPSTVGHR